MSVRSILFLLAFVCCIREYQSVPQNHRSKRAIDPETQKASYLITKELFRRFGYPDDLSLEDLRTILIRMGLGGMYGHNHGNNDGHDHGDHDGHDHGDHDGHDHGDHDGHDHGDHDGHDHGDHDGHDHGDHDGHDHEVGDHEGHDHGDHHHRHKRDTENNNTEECSSVGALLQDLYLPGDTKYLGPDEFLFLCPALVNQLISGACDEKYDHYHDHDHGNRTSDDVDDRNMGLVWFYLMLSVTIISLCAVWGILCIPKRSKSTYEKVIHFLMAMGAGSMAGDALLHLLPHALMPPHDHSAHGNNEHNHDHGGHDHGDHSGHDHGDHGDEHTQALLKGLVALIGLYSFFALERFFSIFLARSSKSGAKVHGHSHADPSEGTKFISTSLSNNTNITDLAPTPTEGNGSINHWPHAHGEHGLSVETPPEHSSSSIETKRFCPKLTPLALMIVLGDMFHNLCDGIAMGAAFSSSTTIGISTSLAVFCHEFPHEVGDFAILIKSGLNKKWAVFLNGASALTCYLGAIIGMFLGSSVGNAPMWIFAGVAGMFLYISLVDLIPEMTHIYLTPGKHWTTFLSLHAGGLILGSFFMFILGLYEHDIQMALA